MNTVTPTRSLQLHVARQADRLTTLLTEEEAEAGCVASVNVRRRKNPNQRRPQVRAAAGLRQFG